MRTFLYVTPVELAHNLRVYLGGGGNSLALVHREGAFLVDPKFGDFALRVRRDVQVDRGHQVRRILLTHHHGDHTAGLDAYPDVQVVLVHPRTRARLRQALGPAWKDRLTPWVEVEHELRLALDGEEVIVRFLGVGHTDGDLVALLPQHRMLLAGDLFLNHLEPRVDSTAGGDILELRRTLDRILDLDFDSALPGHGELGTRGDLQRTRDYLAAMEAQVRQGIAEGKTEDAVARSTTLSQFSDIKNWFGASRDGNVRQMFQSVKHEGDRR